MRADQERTGAAQVVGEALTCFSHVALYRRLLLGERADDSMMTSTERAGEADGDRPLGISER